MSYRIRFHPSVSDDLEWIVGWIADYAGSPVAATKLAEIEGTIRTSEIRPGSSSVAVTGAGNSSIRRLENAARASGFRLGLAPLYKPVARSANP